jgi:hypothetical protein
MDKKIIVHKAKWQNVTASGWKVRLNKGIMPLCNHPSSKPYLSRFHKKKYGNKWHKWGNGSVRWKNVTCKVCLKMKKAHKH